MNPDYKHHAYARTILMELRRHLTDRFTPADGPKADLICEEVYYADRLIPSGDIQAMIDRLLKMEEQERLQMADFVTSRRIAEVAVVKEEVPSEPKGSQGRKRKETGDKDKPVS